MVKLIITSAKIKDGGGIDSAANLLELWRERKNFGNSVLVGKTMKREYQLVYHIWLKNNINYLSSSD